MQVIDFVNKCDASPDQIWSKRQERLTSLVALYGPGVTMCELIEDRDVLNTYTAVFIFSYIYGRVYFSSTEHVRLYLIVLLNISVAKLADRYVAGCVTR